TPGAVLYVNRAEAEVAAAERDRVATLELEEPRNALRRQGANAKAEEDTQRFDAAAQQLEAAVTWRDATVGVIDTTRVLVAGDDRRLVAVTGQCVLGADAAPALAKACGDALTTLETEVPRASRVRLAIAATASEPPPKPAPDVLSDGGTVSLPPIAVGPPRAQTDRRPVFLGAGLIVLAALFWWNRKRRDEIERAETRDELREARATKRRDEDADDLHAAAEASDDGKRT
ncbi:MAG TPA: hypothetical protein VK427_27155, partial [Kofleriaceae bacterium]|nr:hypothetical protein [Kofleriaceae bacterium]